MFRQLGPYDWVVGRGLGRPPPPPPPPDDARCAAPIGLQGRCPQTASGGGALCWDHRCGGCGGAKENKQPAQGGREDTEQKDHIWFAGCARRMEVDWVLPPPPLAELRTGMPGLSWPSDHIALLADLAWD
eukprot:gene1931-47124_t